MQLVEIVQTSQCVAETRARLEKIGHLADCMGRLAAAERESGATGSTKQRARRTR